MMLAAPLAGWLGRSASAMQSSATRGRPNSNFNGVQIGIISYSFRQISYNPEDVLKGMVYLGLNVLEFEQSFFEHYLGAPHDPTGGGQPLGVGTVPAGAPFENRPVHPRPAGQTRREPPTETDRTELRKWRSSPPWNKVRALRAMFEDAGVSIPIVKFPQLGDKDWTDDEINYAFAFAKAMGAHAITCEPPLSQVKRLAPFADKHQMVVGFHNHSSVTNVERFGRPGAWEQAFFYSKYFWANVDVGHFTAGNGFPPFDFIKEYHDRITNVHLKDRKINNGPNVAWGQGDTPIDQILRMMQKERYSCPAMIELEYPIPDGSSVMAELAACVQYCKKALQSA
jgi:sugar phosphate isomerase/epimerase